MAVTLDATGTKLITTVAGTSVNYTGVTVGTGVNRALVVTVACAAAVTAPSATWDSGASNQAMSLISVVKTQTNVTTFMFGLRNPVSGNKTLNVAWTTSAKSNVEAISFTGVEQASDARAFTLANFASDGATLNAITMGITPPRDSIVVASYGTSATFSSLNQTNLFTDITNTGCEGGATRANGAGASISFTGTDTTTAGNKVIVGFAIISDSAPPTVPWQSPVWPKKGLASYLQSFIVAKPVGPPQEDIPKVDRWFAPWREPVRRLPPAIQTLPTWSGFTPPTVSTAVVAGEAGSVGPEFQWQFQYNAKTQPIFIPTVSTDIVASDDGSAGPGFRWRLIYRVKTEPVFVPPVVTYTVTPQWPDRLAAKPSPLNYYPAALVLPTQPTVWSQPPPWPDPIRRKPVADFKPWSFIPNPAQVFFSYAPWDDFARRNRALPDTQPLAWSGFTPASVTFVGSSWPDFAPRAKRAVDFTSWSFIPTPAQVFFPYAPWDDFAKRKPPPLDTQPLAWSGFTPAAVISLVASNWPDFAPRPKRAPDFTSWSFVPPPRQVFFPYAPWDDFARRKQPPLDTQPLAWGLFTPTPVVSTDVVASDNGSAGPSFRWRLIYRVKTEPVFVPVAPPSTDVVAGEAGSVGPEFQRQFQYAVKAEPVLVPAAAFTYSQLTSWPDIIPIRARPVSDFRPWTFVPSPAQVFFPYAPWDDFARRNRPPIDTQPLAWSGFTPAAAQVFFPYAPWDDFAKKPAFAAWQQQALAWSTFTPAVVFFLPERWPDFATKKKPPLNYDPLAFLQVIRSPFNSFVNWPDFAPSARRPLNYEPLTLLQTVRTPWVTMTTWPDFARLERKPGLGAPYQQFTARFVGISTATTITVSMSAFEVNSDTANAVVRVIQSQPAVSALVSIEETGILIDPLPGVP